MFKAVLGSIVFVRVGCQRSTTAEVTDAEKSQHSSSPKKSPQKSRLQKKAGAKPTKVRIINEAGSDITMAEA